MELVKLLVWVLVSAAVYCVWIKAIDGQQVELEWQMLSSTNFSSQIRLHPHVLVIITVPWCGESRSLMNQISHNLGKQPHNYSYSYTSSLKLMFVYRNLDKMLADSFGAADDGITLLCYHHSVSFKYQGPLTLQHILSSLHYFMSLPPHHLPLPLKTLDNSQDLEYFLASTDKAVLLFDSCGWTDKLLALAHHTRNWNWNGNHTPCVAEFRAQNGTAEDNMQATFGPSCTVDEYCKFYSFFSKFMLLATEFYVPPHRQRYGLVPDTSLLSMLGIEDSHQWLLVISYAGCSACLRKFKDETYLQNALKMHDLPVTELLDDRKGLGPVLPIDKPSVVLFVDRTSDSIETRKQSEKSLHAFKELAVQFWKSKLLDWQSSDWPKSSVHYEGSANLFKSHRLRLSSSSQKISYMVINEGNQVTIGNEPSTLQSGSLHEILSYLIGQNKQSKLSSLAKEEGFQLLSDKIDLNIADVSSSHEDSQNHGSSIMLDEVSEQSMRDRHQDFIGDIGPLVEHEVQSLPTNVEALYKYNNQKTSMSYISKVSGIMELDQSLNNHDIASAPFVDMNILTDGVTNKPEHHRHSFDAFNGSFFFCDGNCKFLRSLMCESGIPRIVIIDPFYQQYYVLSEEANYSVRSLSNFIDRFLSGSLIPYQRSGPLRKSIEMPQPPFVNLDFREKDSIPFVTSDTFSELVIGLNASDAQNATNAWHKDVVVLFSNSWCGFCQRMNIIVREVYRTLKGYKIMVESESNRKELFFQHDLKDAVAKLPDIYLIDCTLNECSWILKSMGQRELYPSLLLFPAKRKTAMVYDGDIMVADIIKFIANCGSSARYLAKEKGALLLYNSL